MKPKLTEGWLCRDKDGCLGGKTPKRPLVFIKRDCILIDGFWTFAAASCYASCWAVKDFKATYSRNFQLPKPGEKVKCWVEL